MRISYFLGYLPIVMVKLFNTLYTNDILWSKVPLCPDILGLFHIINQFGLRKQYKAIKIKMSLYLYNVCINESVNKFMK